MNAKSVNREAVVSARHSEVLHRFDKGDDVLTDELLPALVWRCGNQKRELARLNEENERLRHDVGRAIANHSADLSDHVEPNDA